MTGGRGFALPLVTQKREKNRKIFKRYWCSNYFWQVLQVGNRFFVILLHTRPPCPPHPWRIWGNRFLQPERWKSSVRGLAMRERISFYRKTGYYGLKMLYSTVNEFENYPSQKTCSRINCSGGHIFLPVRLC